MKAAFYIVNTYFKGCWLYLTNNSKKNALLYRAFANTIEFETYRLGAEAQNDFFIAFRIFKRNLLAILKSRNANKVLNKSSVAILEGDLKYYPSTLHYVNAQSKDEIGLFIGKNNLIYSQGLFHTLLMIIVQVLLFFPVFILSTLSKRKAGFALLLSYIAETMNLFMLLNKHGITKVYYFCIFELDSNMAAYMLMKKGIRVEKIIANASFLGTKTCAIADKLYLTFKAQEDFLALHKETLSYKEKELWFPEETFHFIEKYKNGIIKTPPFTLGFYSSGAWKRKERGEVDFEGGYYEIEELVLTYLKEYVLQHPNVSFIMYLHPLEKKADRDWEKSQEHYNKWFEGVKVNYADRNTPTAQSFESCDVAVSINSTVLYSRLFVGYKSIFSTLWMKGIFVPGGNFSNICADTKEKFFELLNKNIPLSEEEYFQKNKLEGFRYNDILNARGYEQS